jgi:hypothetical protein
MSLFLLFLGKIFQQLNLECYRQKLLAGKKIYSQIFNEDFYLPLYLPLCSKLYSKQYWGKYIVHINTYLYFTAKKLVPYRFMIFCSAVFIRRLHSIFETLAIIVCISFGTVKGTVYSTGESTVYCTFKHIRIFDSEEACTDRFMLFCNSAAFYQRITFNL